MNLGTDPKKMVLLGGLAVLGGYLFYSNVLSQPSAQASRSTRIVSHDGVAPSFGQMPVRAAVRRPVSSHASDEFRPSMLPPRPEDRIDPMKIDPTLRKDLLAKVQAVELQGGNRNLFQYSTAPPPPLPKEPTVPVGAGAKNPNLKATAAMPPHPAAAPPPPPIPLKYYGYSTAGGDTHKHAFFLDGDDILVAGEGEMMKKRYRVVHIGVNSVVVEDTQFKHEQTLILQEAAG
jgi:hypothetical protein